MQSREKLELSTHQELFRLKLEKLVKETQDSVNELPVETAIKLLTSMIESLHNTAKDMANELATGVWKIEDEKMNQ